MTANTEQERESAIDRVIDFFASVPDVAPWVGGALYALSFLTSFMTTTAGLGGGLLMLGALSAVYPPAVVIPVHGFVQLGANGGRALLMYGHVMARYLPAFVAGCLVGASAGTQVVIALPTALLQAILGVFILYMLWGPPIRGLRPSRATFFGLGGVATFASMLVGVTGPLIAPFVAAASEDHRDVVSTHATMMMVLHVFKLVAFAAMGFAFAPYAGLIVGMIVTGFLGTLAGRYLLYRIPERSFRVAFKAVMTVLALRLLYIAFV